MRLPLSTMVRFIERASGSKKVITNELRESLVKRRYEHDNVTGVMAATRLSF